MLESLARYDTPTVSNAIEAFGVRPDSEGFSNEFGTRTFGEGQIVVGRAVTATIRSRHQPLRAGPLDQLYQLVDELQEPAVVVVADLDDPPGLGAFLGEVQGTILTRLGAVGFVTNGSVRDLPQLRRIGLATLAGSVSVSHAYVHVEQVGVPVEIAGLPILPGDLLHADQHGLLSIPEGVAGSVADVASAVVAAEEEVIRWVGSPAFRATELLPRLASVRSAIVEAGRAANPVTSPLP
jgi:4-hydroxy-4-methyl-2-oxoglutarate aldolase